MKINVIGCGRWGSCIAWHLDRTGHEVGLYGPADTPDMQRFTETGTNGIITLTPSMRLIYDLDECLDAEAVVISINSQGLRSLCAEIKQSWERTSAKSQQVVMSDRLSEVRHPNEVQTSAAGHTDTFILCMKGIEIETGMRLTEVMADCLPEAKTAVWIGPGHPQEFVRGVPNCMVIDSADDGLKRRLVDSFNGELIRFFSGDDLIGNEIGAAAKNVIGIAAGMLDGFDISSLKGPLMSRGTHEVARLIKALGGNELSAYGLCHLGDYEATVFSKYSHNRQFGESFVRGEKYTALAEGYYTCAAIRNLCKKYDVDMPICRAVYKILYEGRDPHDALNRLFTRSVKTELE